jgi:hypothetical protein
MGTDWEHLRNSSPSYCHSRCLSGSCARRPPRGLHHRVLHPDARELHHRGQRQSGSRPLPRLLSRPSGCIAVRIRRGTIATSAARRRDLLAALLRLTSVPRRGRQPRTPTLGQCCELGQLRMHRLQRAEPRAEERARVAMPGYALDAGLESALVMSSGVRPMIGPDTSLGTSAASLPA